MTLSCSAAAMLALDSGMPTTRFPIAPRQRLAVASYPFRHLLKGLRNPDRDLSKAGMDLPSFARFVKSEFHVNLIEPLDGHFESTEDHSIHKLAETLKAEGMGVANIPIDDQVDLCSKDETLRTTGYATYRRWIDIAHTLGSPSIRVTLPKCADLPSISSSVQALMPTLLYARSRGIVVLLENDDPVLASQTRILAAIREANIPSLRALPDFANSLMGGDERFNDQAVQGMFAHAWNIAHVKDAEMIGGKRRTVSLPRLFGYARASGFHGYFSMESDSDADPIVDTTQLITQSIALM